MKTPTRRELLADGTVALALATVPAYARASAIAVTAAGKARVTGCTPLGRGRVTTRNAGHDVTIVGLSALGGTLPGDGEIGVVFDAIPGLATGVQLWRYTPWKAWTLPLAVASPADLKADDVQFFYWRESDGSFAAAVPLSGHGLRSTLGRVGTRFAVRASAGAGVSLPETMPLVAIGHGTDPHLVIASTYRAALHAMDRDDAAAPKTLPEPLAYLGWNSWNASDLGRSLDEALLVEAATRLHAAGAPVGWMLIDDGWFDHRDQRLRGFLPDRTRFPRGFAPVVETLKRDHGIRHVGAWLAIDGYWHGIDPASPLGKIYERDLFTWTERSNVADPGSPIRTDSFIRPDRPSMARFYDEQLGALRAAGIDFIKVDNQLVIERMAKRNFPIWQLATAMHRGVNAAAARHFDAAMINCMDLTADAYFNFGKTPVARAVEDYFPYKPGETYDLEQGNAAAHVLQALYNALYVSQVAIPDFDMFETTNPNARLHAVARAANNGPIYVTDLPGHHDAALLRSMTLADGRSLRADRPLLPCADCLFQLQEPMPFKAFSGVGRTGLLMIANLADVDRVTGKWSGGDVPGFGDQALVAYEHLSGRMVRLAPGEAAEASLPRFGVELWSLHDAASGFAFFGRSDKINGPATVLATAADATGLRVTLAEIGPSAAFCRARPTRVTVDRRSVDWEWADGLLHIAVPVSGAGTVDILVA